MKTRVSLKYFVNDCSLILFMIFEEKYFPCYILLTE